ncbi:cytochrome P450 [Phlyctema vagabunda]|uniref:Cytochrome P450 n=1 Tax=Phlyctema vagabunda TaxID=108571 RepID=A0ABR4PEL7_9HELO
MEMHASDSFSTAFEFASGATGERFQNPLWQVTELFVGGQFRQSIAKVKAFGTRIVSNAVSQRNIKTPSPPVKDVSDAVASTSGSLINSLLDTINDERVVADAALNYLSAGRDTTAQALTWVFYLLMRHPSVTEAIRKEIQSLGTTTSSPMIFHPTTLPYAMAVFYETLRLYPPVPFELKQCSQETTLPDGTYLPKTAVLVWCTWAMNRSHQTWGEDAEAFVPERWLDNEGLLVQKTAFEFPVFNGGPRTCLGKKMAEVVAVQIIATLVDQFDFVPVDQRERISKNSLTLPMEGGLPCFIRPRSISK